MKHFVKLCFFLPLILLVSLFSAANRHGVILSFDPFYAADSPFHFRLPLFVIISLCLILGGALGGLLTWIGQRKYRRFSYKAYQELLELHQELKNSQRQLPPPPSQAHFPIS